VPMELLRQFESLLYTASMWLLFIPKMFIGLILQPWKIVPHVDAELAKDPEDRFQGSINPLVYFVLVIVFPAIFAFSAVAANHKAKDDLSAFLGLVGKLSFDLRVEMLSVFLLAFPLGIALVVNRKMGVEITLEGMRRAYYAQCLCGVSFGFFLFALTILMYVDPTALDTDTPDVRTFPFILLFGWFAYGEVVVIRAMTKENTAYAILRMFYGIGVGYLIALAAEFPLLGAIMSGYGGG
jgi:hypothetical protein